MEKGTSVAIALGHLAKHKVFVYRGGS
jgi:hypothetical protein